MLQQVRWFQMGDGNQRFMIRRFWKRVWVDLLGWQRPCWLARLPVHSRC